MLALFTDLVTDEIARYGYVAIFALMLLESACVPVPSEVTMLFGGAMATASLGGPEHLDLVTVAIVGAVANLVGSWLAYWVGYVGGRPLAVRWGRYILIRPREIDRADEWFERHGEAAVFIGRLLPVVRTFISLPAGVARMNFWRFSLYTLLGCLPWTFGLTWLGFVLGSEWGAVEALMRPFAWAIAAAVALGAVWWVRRRLHQIREETDAERDRERERTPSS